MASRLAGTAVPRGLRDSRTENSAAGPETTAGRANSGVHGRLHFSDSSASETKVAVPGGQQSFLANSASRNQRQPSAGTVKTRRRNRETTLPRKLCGRETSFGSFLCSHRCCPARRRAALLVRDTKWPLPVEGLFSSKTFLPRCPARIGLQYLAPTCPGLYFPKCRVRAVTLAVRGPVTLPGSSRGHVFATTVTAAVMCITCPRRTQDYRTRVRALRTKTLNPGKKTLLWPQKRFLVSDFAQPTHTGPGQRCI
eukprot:XP_028334140.1 uncharacterized protein LOC114484133 [Physeter catodon]